MKKTLSRLALLATGLLLATGAALPLLRTIEWQELDDAARTRAPGAFLQLSQGTTHYVLTGPADGRPVVLVHGFSVPSYIWDGTAEALAAAGFRVLRYDLWGRGWSDRPDVVYDFALFEGQLTELLDAVGLTGPVDLVGLSMGGALVAGYAANHPERVRRVALVDPFHRAADLGLLEVRGVGDWLAHVTWAPGLAQGQRSDFVHPERFPDWAERYTEQMRYDGFVRALLSTGRAFLSQDPLPYFQGLAARKKPVLLVWGTRDTTTPFSGSVLLRDVLHPEFLAVEGAGHLPHLEQPD
ncbi:MAG: alpha/beta hydrolase, partial [Myxococcaceae bacterium]|nr:alpha/beta hydrolase [Myxococcaceae bacterium]